ncbi:MAG: DUF2628 domain-containing protein [Alphaproteobacteria bacterium]
MTTRLYSVHLGQDGGEMKLVREGFSWPAFLLAVPWALWHRMWWLALLFVVAQGLLGGAAVLFGLNEAGQSAAALGLAVLIGFAADELRRNHLATRGYTFEDIVVAENIEMAERRVLDSRPDWLRTLKDGRP